MGTELRKTRHRVEEAFASYLKTWLESDDAPDGLPESVQVFIRHGELSETGTLVLENPDEIPLPSVIVSAPSAKRHDMGYGVVDFHVIVAGGTDGDDAPTKHELLVGAVSACLGEENRETVRAALSPPESGPDERDVKEFRCFGYILDTEFSQESGRAWIDDLVFSVHAQATDDISG